MADQNQIALADLLRRTQSAHHEHQENDLGGKTNEDWPQWYAQFLIENGIADFISKKPKQADLSSFLKQSYERFEANAGKGDWGNFVAGEILDHEDLKSPSAPVPEEPMNIPTTEAKTDEIEEDSA